MGEYLQMIRITEEEQQHSLYVDWHQIFKMDRRGEACEKSSEFKSVAETATGDQYQQKR